MNYCLYYQANIVRADTWYVTAVLRSFEHLCFDRTLGKEAGLFEFYVPEKHENYFLEIMRDFQAEGMVHHLRKMENRLLNPEETL